MSRDYGARCGMCGIDLFFEGQEERRSWLELHDGDHRDFVSFFSAVSENPQPEGVSDPILPPLTREQRFQMYYDSIAGTYMGPNREVVAEMLALRLVEMEDADHPNRVEDAKRKKAT